MSHPITELAWLHSARVGDQNALQQLLVAQSPSLKSYIQRRLASNQSEAIEPDDLVQQTLVDICRGLPAFRGQTLAEFESWTRTIALRNIFDATRKQARWKRLGALNQRPEPTADSFQPLMQALEIHPAPIPTPSSCVRRDEVVEQVRTSLTHLPSDYQLAVDLRYLQGLSLEEVAQRMGRGPRAIQGILDRARRQLRGRLNNCHS